MRRRVVVTGVGLCTPLGVGREATWEALMAGRSGIGPITKFDASKHSTHFAGEVRGLTASDFMERREARHLDDFTLFAIFAAQEAVAHAQLTVDRTASGRALAGASYAPERVGVYVGCGMGGVAHIEQQQAVMASRGPSRISPYFIPQIISNIAPGLIAMRLCAKGPNFSTVSACASGAHAIGIAARTVERGDADVMVAGGTEAAVTALSVGGFNALRALSTRNADPARASRPFDRDRDGFVIGEGAGILVLEGLDTAEARGAPILAELCGFGASADAHHMTSPPDDGEGAQRSMRLALEDAAGLGVLPRHIGYINAHGSATRQGDAIETAAIKQVFGEHARRLMVSSTKSMTGHLLGAAGGVEAAFTALALARGAVPPTINLDQPDPVCDLDYVPHHGRSVALHAALTNSFGFGGTNATLLFRSMAAARR